jgi:hypothetical protein
MGMANCESYSREYILIHAGYQLLVSFPLFPPIIYRDFDTPFVLQATSKNVLQTIQAQVALESAHTKLLFI